MVSSVYTLHYGNPALWGDVSQNRIARVLQHAGRGSRSGTMHEYDTTAVNDCGTDTDRTRVPVAGGVLVYEARAVGKELVGFEAVEDWAALADAVAARGHGRGAVYHNPELDV